MERARDGEDEEFKRSESELEKLIREVKNIERQEIIEKQSSKSDHITSHFDQSTIRLEPRNGSLLMSESVLRNIFSSFGIIDGVTMTEDLKAYVMFRYRDSALKALRALSDQTADSNNNSDERRTLLKDFKLKIVSTTGA